MTLLLLALTLTTCIRPTVDIPEEVTGLAPIYATDDWETIEYLGPQPVYRLGKIYYKAPYIFVSENYQGVHIIDNSDPYQPERVGFLRIYGQTDMAIRGDVLYANNGEDLVAIDISELTEPKLLSRTPKAFPNINAASPDGYAGWFECVDPARGTVIGWEERTLARPECWR